MDRLEFNNTIKYAGFNFDDGTIKDNCGKMTKCYDFNNIKYYFGGTFYAVVKGKIPLEVANSIYKKYPSNQYKIRVAGACIDEKPNDWARDEIFDQEIEEINKKYCAEEWVAKYEEADKRLEERPDENKYIEYYHIDTEKGLQIFLNEMREYYSRESQISTEDHKKTKQLKRE